MRPPTFKSRAAVIRIPNPRRKCRLCGRLISARKNLDECVAINVVTRGVWVDGYIAHPHCYEAQGKPYGEPEPRKKRPAPRKGVA